MTGNRGFWIACALGGALVLLGCVLPTIEVTQEAFIGAGEAQRGFDYERTVRFVTYGEPGALLFVLGGAALVLAAVLGFRRPRSPLLILAAAAVSVVFVVEVVRISDELRWDDDSGLYSCDEPLERCVPFIAPATRALQAEIRRRPEAREPEFELLDRNGYRARGKLGWTLIAWTSVVLAGVTLYRAFLLVLRPVWAGVALLLCGLLVFAYLVLRSLENLE
jgi:hypothetical protein